MKRKELEVIQNSIRTVRDNMGILLAEDGHYRNIQDAELRKLYYDLNDMCLLLGQKMEEDNG